MRSAVFKVWLHTIKKKMKKKKKETAELFQGSWQLNAARREPEATKAKKCGEEEEEEEEESSLG